MVGYNLLMIMHYAWRWPMVPIEIVDVVTTFLFCLISSTETNSLGLKCLHQDFPEANAKPSQRLVNWTRVWSPSSSPFKPSANAVSIVERKMVAPTSPSLEGRSLSWWTPASSSHPASPPTPAPTASARTPPGPAISAAVLWSRARSGPTTC